MGHVREKLELCLLAGHSAHHASIVDVDALDDGAWHEFLARAEANAADVLELLRLFQGALLRDATNIVAASATRRNVPGAIRVGLALFFGKVMSPRGKVAEATAAWFSKDNAKRAAELCAAQLFDAASRVRHAAVQALSVGVAAQPFCIGMARDEILKPLSCCDRGALSSSIRADGLRSLRACMTVLPRKIALTVAAMLVDADDDVQGAACALLVDYLENAGSPLLRKELLDGLIRGWYDESDDEHATPRDAEALAVTGTEGKYMADEEIDPSSILLLLSGHPQPPHRLSVQQSISARSAVRRLVPRGYPLAIRAALTLLHSAGGEGEEEEAEDLRAVSSGALALAILGPGEGEEAEKTIDAIVARMRSSDTPMLHLPLLASALHGFAEAPSSVEELAAGASLSLDAVLPPRRPPAARVAGRGAEDEEVRVLAQEEAGEAMRWARATLLGVQRGLAAIVQDVETAQTVLDQSQGKKNAVRVRMLDDRRGPDEKAALSRELVDLETAARQARATLQQLTDPRGGDELVRQLVQVLSSACWIYASDALVGAPLPLGDAISVLKRKKDLEELTQLVQLARLWVGGEAFARHVYGRRAVMGLLGRLLVIAALPPAAEGQQEDEVREWVLDAVAIMQTRVHGAPARAPGAVDAQDPEWGEDGQLPAVFQFLAPPDPPLVATPSKRAGFGEGFGGASGAASRGAGAGGGFGGGGGGGGFGGKGAGGAMGGGPAGGGFGGTGAGGGFAGGAGGGGFAASKGQVGGGGAWSGGGGGRGVPAAASSSVSSASPASSAPAPGGFAALPPSGAKGFGASGRAPGAGASQETLQEAPKEASPYGARGSHSHSESASSASAVVSLAGGDKGLMGQVEELLLAGGELVMHLDDDLAHGLIDSLLHRDEEDEKDEDGAGGGTALGAMVSRYALEHAWDSAGMGGPAHTGQDQQGWEKHLMRPGLRQHVARVGDTVSLQYVCRLASGQEIDSSYKRNRPVTATLGAEDELGVRLIRGWDQGIVGMCLGEKVQLKVQASAAYGTRGGMDVVSPGADLTFEVELVALNGHGVEGVTLPSARSEATTVQSDAPTAHESADAPPRQARRLLFQPQPPDQSPVVRVAGIHALAAVLGHAWQPASLVQQAQADACHVTQELVDETAQLLAQLAPCEARALVHETLLAPALPAPDAEGRVAQAVCRHLRTFVASVAGGGEGSEGRHGRHGHQTGSTRSHVKWYRTPAAVGRAVVRSIVQALDDHSPLVRAAASRALVSVALHASSGHAAGQRTAAATPAGPAPWHGAVVGEVLQRIGRAAPPAPTTVCHDPGKRGVEAAGDAGKVWMDASRVGGSGCKGIAVSHALQSLCAIFRGRRLAFGPEGTAREQKGSKTETEVLEKEAAQAILRGLADSDGRVREVALAGIRGRCLDASTRAVRAALGGLGNVDDTSAEGSMYRGRPWLSGRSLQASTRAAYVRATGALSAGPNTTWSAASLGVAAPDVQGAVCEKWLAGWCQASGALGSQPLQLLDALQGAAPLVDGREDQAPGGGRKEAEAEMLVALREALPIKSAAAAASSSSSLAYGRVRAMPWKPVRREPSACAESGGWEEAGRVFGVVQSLGNLGPLGSSSAIIEMVLKAADSTDAGVRRGAVQALARIISQEHLLLPRSSAVPGTGSAQRVGLPLGPAAQAPILGWDRAARGGEMIAALRRLAADPVAQVATEAAALLARWPSFVANGDADPAWVLSGKSGCGAWGTDAAAADRRLLRSGRLGPAPAWGIEAARTRAHVRSLSGCAYVSKFGVGPLHTHARLPCARADSKMGWTAQVVYPHVMSQRNEHYTAGAEPVGLAALQDADARSAEREAIIQKPRDLWAARA